MSKQTLPDGTPISEVLAQLDELQADRMAMKKEVRTALFTIINLCEAPHWTAARRHQIRDIAAALRKSLRV